MNIKKYVCSLLLATPLMANATAIVPMPPAATPEAVSWRDDMNQAQAQLLEQMSRRLSQAGASAADVAALKDAAAAKQAAGDAAPQIAQTFAFNNRRYTRTWRKLAEVWPQQNLSCHTPALATANAALLKAEYAYTQGKPDTKQVQFAGRMIASAHAPCTTGEPHE